MKNYLIYILCCVTFYSCATGKRQLNGHSGIKSSSEYYSSAMENAKKYEQSGFKDEEVYQKAIDDFQEVLFVEKLNSDAWYNFGRTLFYGGDYTRAQDAFRTAIKYRKNFVESYSMLIKVLVAEHNIDLAVAVAEKEYENIPDNEMAMNDLATMYMMVKRYDEAFSLSRSAIKKNTKFTPAYIVLGNIYYAQKKYELARLLYLKAADQGDDSGELYTNMGLVAIHTEDKDSILGYFKKGVEKAPSNPYTHLNLGNYFVSTGDYEGGISEFDAALKLSPFMVEAIVGKGGAYMQLKLFDKAEALYKKALSIDTDCAEAYFNYGILIADYRPDKIPALGFFKKFVELKGPEIGKDHVVYKYMLELKPNNVKQDKVVPNKVMPKTIGPKITGGKK